jgi:ABC-type Fe3+ transport system substrate-binding protein
MKEGSHISTDFATISFLERAPHPNTAKLFVNWVLSREGQKVYQEILWDNGKGRALNSLRLDVFKDHLPPEERLKEGVPYKIYDSPKTINLKPAYEVINKALADAGRK